MQTGLSNRYSPYTQRTAVLASVGRSVTVERFLRIVHQLSYALREILQHLEIRVL